MKENNITAKIILIKLIMMAILILNIYTLAGCTFSDISLSTTKLAAEFNNDYIYFYRYDDINKGEQNDRFVLIQYNIKTREEKEIVKTNALVGVRVYNNHIYYFDENSHDLYAINEKTLKSNMIYDTQDSLPKNNYIDLGSKFIYLDSDILNIKDKHGKHQIENVWNFNVHKNQIYYVDVNTESENNWSIKKLKNNFETETVLNLKEIKNSFEDSFREYGQIDNISICDNKLYFTIAEYPTGSRCQLFYYDLKHKELDRVINQYIYEYQATENALYYIDYNRVLKKYCFGNTPETIYENVYSFKVTDDNKLMYMKLNDNTIYIVSEDSDMVISNIVS